MVVHDALPNKQRVASLKEIVEFRHTIFLMQTEFPFSRPFGRANTREACVISSAELYRRLMGRQSCKEVLQFATLSEISANVDGTVNNAKMKGLVQLFGPDKDRVLTLLDFTKV